MRLLFVLFSLGSGGAERVTASLANYWASRGFDVSLLTFAAESDDFYPLHPSICRIALNQVAISANPFVAVVANIRRIRSLRQVLTRLRPEVAIAMMASANVTLALASFGLPCLVTIGSERTYPPQMPLGYCWGLLRWCSYALLSSVITQTKCGADWIRTHTLCRRVAVIENPLSWPLPVQSPVLLPDDLIAPNDRLLLAVGRLGIEKGFDLLLAAFARLAPRYPGWRLVVLGEGQERAALECLRAANGLTGRVLLPGLVGNVSDWHARADLFVMPSRFEGFPNALAEAMAAGLPVVSSDCLTGPSELVDDGVTGCLVPTENVDALEEALELLMSNPDLRVRIGANAIRVRQRLSCARIASQWELLFHRPAVVR